MMLSSYLVVHAADSLAYYLLLVACEFESKWKSISRKLPHKRKNNEDSSLHLLQHRQTALDRVKKVLNCGHLQIDWKLNPL